MNHCFSIKLCFRNVTSPFVISVLIHVCLGSTFKMQVPVAFNTETPPLNIEVCGTHELSVFVCVCDGERERESLCLTNTQSDSESL